MQSLCTERVIDRVSVFVPFDRIPLGALGNPTPQLTPEQLNLGTIKEQWKNQYGLYVDNFTLFQFATHEDGRLALRYHLLSSFFIPIHRLMKGLESPD